MHLLPHEKEAADYVTKISIIRAERVLNALCRRFDRRFKKACEESFTPINREWVRKTPLEIDLMHKLKLGIMLTDDYLTPVAAHARILARIAARRANTKSN